MNALCGRAARWLTLVVVSTCNFACLTSHTLLQTAHTEPAGHARFKAGLASVWNASDRSLVTNTSTEPGGRLGLNDSIDLGLSSWFGLGASLDAKWNLIDNRARAALAPRLAAGYSFGPGRTAFGLEAGVIASYRLSARWEPYLGLGFANHWLASLGRDVSALPQNQRYAPRRGYGDGLIKTSLGLEFRVAGGLRTLLEYAHWFPAQDDPGDDYALLSNDVLALSLAYCTSP